ncbi:MAG: hypothetical protein RSC76_07805, partial [Oscillospiraceae bacterium]
EEQKLLETLTQRRDNSRILQMSDGESVLGWIAVDIQKNILRLLQFHLNISASPTEEEFYLDTLMRSAASYGETNGASYIETVDNTYNCFLQKRGYTVDSNHAFTPMSTIVHYS